jgi:hypothetical protein
MAAPSTIAAAGFFDLTRNGTSLGEAQVFMASATAGTLRFQGQDRALTANSTSKTLKGKIGTEDFSLKMLNRKRFTGKISGDDLEFNRLILRPRSAAEMAQSDPGPNSSFQAIFAATPDFVAATGETKVFWHNFGNLFYRGRLDGSARVMFIASDPGPAECLPFVRRSLIGDSGQKTQGFLAKLGLTRSYVLVNAFSVAMRPSEKTKGLAILKNNLAIRQSRHDFYNAILSSGQIEAIVAFGEVAQIALAEWEKANAAVKNLPRFKLAHPAAVDRSGSGNDAALKGWAKGITDLRAIVTPDADGDTSLPNFGKYFTEADYVRIPRRDLPAVAPIYVGDDSWGRFATPRHNNCAKRPSPDDRKSLILTPSPGQGQVLRYRYLNGALQGAKSKNGSNVPVDGNGLEL